MGHTDTTQAQLKLFGNRIRSYTNDAGERVNDHKAKVAIDFANPDDPALQIVVTKGVSETDPDVGDLREIGEVDIVIRGQSRKDAPTMHALADLVTQALVGYREPGTADHGLTVVTGVRRGTIDFAEDPTTDETIELPLVAEYYSWPTLLTDALT